MQFSKFIDWALFVVGVAAVAYHMVSTQYLLVGSYEHQTIHLAFLFGLIFLGSMHASDKTIQRAGSALLLLLGLFATGYVYFRMRHLESVIGFPDTIDVLIGALLVALVMEGTRRAWGPTLPIVVGIFIVYFLWGHYLPRPLYHREFDFGYIVSYLSIGFSGIYGNFLGISANFVFLFVIYGALLEIIKVNDLFYELGKCAGRVFQGGPAQTAVISSALVGTVTGAAVANVAVTGAFTIPYMKRSGYTPEQAGAIEATASTGGQIMPPVMGAAAFLMASFLGVPYSTIMLAGLLPAILYFWGCVLSVQMIAVRYDLQPPKEAIDKGLILRRLPLFVLPLGLLIVMLLMRYSPSLAAFWAILVSVALSAISSETRPSLLGLLNAFARGARIGAQIGIALAIVGLMAQTLITTGLGTQIAELVVTLSGGHLWVALLLTMVVSLILGLGIPTSAAYALVAIVVAPGLVKMGVTPIAAHMFAFYFAVVSAVTPPVALAALAGAGIAGGDYTKTALLAFKIAISGFIIPFLIVYNPVMILQPESVASAIGSAIAISLGMTALSMALFGCGLTRLSRHEWCLAVASAFLMLGYVMLRHFDALPLEYPMLVLGALAFGLLAVEQIKNNRDSRGRFGTSVLAEQTSTLKAKETR